MQEYYQAAMTFIASVIAKKGVAVIADSLVTSEMPILKYRNFIDYINGQPKNEEGETLVNTNQIISLFQHEPIFTKDFEEKLFQLNRFTAVTTTGAAYINDKSISDLIEEFKALQIDLEDMAVSFDEKLKQLCNYLNKVVREHLDKYPVVRYCTFIITYYEKHTHKTHIYKAVINEAGNEALASADYDFVTLTKEQDWVKVVCDGQNKISDKILYGLGKSLYGRFDAIVSSILEDLQLQPDAIPPNFLVNLMNKPFFSQLFFEDLELLNLTDLSVQQAVDLASLLMRLEVDFQKYTKNIPTVGGVIKLAVIDENGFRFIAGHNIESPKHINL